MKPGKDVDWNYPRVQLGAVEPVIRGIVPANGNEKRLLLALPVRGVEVLVEILYSDIESLAKAISPTVRESQ